MSESDRTDTAAVPWEYQARTSGWDRFVAAAKTWIIFGVALWLATILTLQFSAPQMRWRMRNRVALAVGLSTATVMAIRRYAVQYYLLSASDEEVVLRSSAREVRLDPLEIQGIVGAGGMNLRFNDALVWKYVVLLTRGKRYVVSFDQATNETTYEVLRDYCAHAWGVPYEGQLQTPVAGAELDPEEYVDALRQVHGFYRLHTVKSLFNGLLMMLGAGVAIFVLATNLPQARRAARLYFSLIVVAFLGLLMAIRAVRKVPVLMTIKRTELRLREAI